MKQILDPTDAQVAGLATIAGMRGTLAPMIVSHYFSRHPSGELAVPVWRMLQWSFVATGAKLLAAAELMGDKVPGAPDRIIAPQVAVRVASGALAGGAVYKTQKRSIWKGALFGAIVTLGATYISFVVRKNLGRTTKLPDFALGVIEDIIALGAGYAIMSSLEKTETPAVVYGE